MNQSLKDDYFRLLYYSANPEDGERVCVAILASVGGRWSVEFDENFTKLKAMAREKDVEFVRGVIELLQGDLDRSDVSSLMIRFEPQFRASEARKLLAPWTPEVRRSLRNRFLFRGKFREDELEHEHEEKVQGRIDEFLEGMIPRAREFAISKLRPSQLLGEDLSRELRIYKPVARALVGRTRAVLIDGVDTTLKPSSHVIQKANRIAFTFWQLGRIVRSPLMPSTSPHKIFRVGIVFDGLPSAHMLREYSLHQFQKDADLAIESTERKGLARMKEELESTLQDIKL